MNKLIGLLACGIIGYATYTYYEEKEYLDKINLPKFKIEFQQDIEKARKREQVPTKEQFSLAILVDKEVKGMYEKKNENWENRLFEAINEANYNLKKEFNIELVVSSVKEWDSPDYIRNIDDLFLSRYAYPVDADFVILCTGQYINGGIAEYRGRYTLINATYPKQVETFVILHEVSHLLGARHVVERDEYESYLMYPELSSKTKIIWDNDSTIYIKRNIRYRLTLKQNAQIPLQQKGKNRN